MANIRNVQISNNTQRERIAKQQALAQQLMAQGQQSYAPTTPGAQMGTTATLAPIIQAALGAYVGRRADKEQDRYDSEQEAQRKLLAQALMPVYSETPATGGGTGNIPGMGQGMDQQQPQPAPVPETREARQQRLMQLALSSQDALAENPMLAQLYQQALAPDSFELKDLGDRYARINSRTGEAVNAYAKGATPDAAANNAQSERNSQRSYDASIYGTDVGASTTRRGQDITARTAAADRRSREDISFEDRVSRGIISSADRESNEAIAGAQIDYKISKDEREQALADQKRSNAAVGQYESSQNVRNAVAEAKDLTSMWNTGAFSHFAAVGGTSARDLQGKLDTIKANLSFDKLAEMRANSPTGGALGSVTERELALLSSAVASLDQAQTKAQVISSLDKIDTHYANWQKAIEESGLVRFKETPLDSAVNKYLPKTGR